MTDTPRWERVASEPPLWSERSRAVAAFIPRGSRVLDVGAGSGGLRSFLPAGCSYQPMDCIPTPGTVLCDFNAHERPDIRRDSYDAAVCAGILEYLNDPTGCLRDVSAWARAVVFTYALLGNRSELPARRASGWVNDIDKNGVQALILGAKLAREASAMWRDQGIYRVRRAA